MYNKALFLDRDGTLIVDRHYLSDPSQVELLPGVREALCRFLSTGYRLFLFTNQSGVGRGMFSLQAVHLCNQRMLQLLDLPPPGFTEICIATEAPDQLVEYRKPSPRFILEMLAKYSLMPNAVWMVGDKLLDVQTGLNAGVQSALIHSEIGAVLPKGAWLFRDLGELFLKLMKAGHEHS